MFESGEIECENYSKNCANASMVLPENETQFPLQAVVRFAKHLWRRMNRRLRVGGEVRGRSGQMAEIGHHEAKIDHRQAKARRFSFSGNRSKTNFFNVPRTHTGALHPVACFLLQNLDRQSLTGATLNCVRFSSNLMSIPFPFGTNRLLNPKLAGVRPQMIDFGSWQGPSEFSTGAIARYFED